MLFDHVPEKSRTSTDDEVLQEMVRHFCAVTDYFSDAVALSTSDGTVFFINPAYVRLYGYRSEDICGKNFSLIFAEQERASAQELYRHFFQSPTISPSIETTVVRSDGMRRDVESRYTFITHQGRRIAMISIIRDITEQKRAEEAFRISQQQLHRALEIGRMASWEWDVESDTVCWSAMHEGDFGLVPKSFKASYESFLALVHPQDRPLVDQEMKQALEGEVDFKVDFRVVSPHEQTSWIRIQGEVLYDEAGKPLRIVGISTQITQERCSENTPE